MSAPTVGAVAGPDAPRVAVVGSGPSGLYTVAALLAAGQPIHIDVIDRLPTPFGLVRYGVAPDHPKMKAVARVLAKPFATAGVRFLGNVEIGRDIDLADLRRHYHAVVHASGLETDNHLGIPGEDLPGATGSAAFVRWYNGHPDAAGRPFTLDVEQVAVVGAGNVALDVARVLARTPAEMEQTDVPEPVLAALRDSAVTDVHVLIRRGPREARFTPAELYMIGGLAGTDVLVHDRAGDLDDDTPADDERVNRNLEIFRTFADGATAAPTPGRRRVHLHFLTTPVEILGADRVTGLVVEQHDRGAGGRIVPTGLRRVLDVGMVVSAVGFRGEPVPGLPVDPATGRIPQQGGRVVEADGSPVAGCYVAGWRKRGPSGVIGTNKPDGAETARAVLADLPTLPEPADRSDVTELLAGREVVIVDWDGWLRLDAHEAAAGSPAGRGRVKLSDLTSMLAQCRPGPGHREPDRSGGRPVPAASGAA